MKKILLFILVLSFVTVHSQDVIENKKDNSNSDNVVENKISILSIEETENFIIEYFNNYCYVWKHMPDKYEASFIDNKLLLIVVSQNGLKGKKKNYYDFSKIYNFDGISKRGSDKVVLNMYISKSINYIDNTYSKSKFRITVIGLENGEKLREAFKHYNKLLLEKNKEN